jgi:hypothetical protein
MAAEIGALRVSLSADTAQFERGLKQAQSSLGSFGASALRFGTLAGAIGLAFAAVSAAVSAFQRGVADVTAMDKLAQSTGRTIDEINALRIVAGQSGIEFEQLGGVIDSFSNRISQGLQSPTSAVSQSLRAMGISAEEARQGFIAIMPALADAFSSWRDGFNKSAIAAALFGEQAGPMMARFLSQGSDALREQIEQAQAHSRAIDPGKVREFNSANLKLQEAMRQLSIEFGLLASGPAARVVENLTALIGWLNQAVGNTDALTRAMQAYDRQLADVEALERAIAEGRAGRNPRTQRDMEETLRKGRERLEQLRQEMVLQAQLAQRPPPTPTPDQRPQAPPIDTRAIAEAQAQLQQMMTALQGQDPTRSIISQYLYGGQEPGVWTEGFKAAMDKIDQVGRLSGQTATQIANQKIALMRQEQQMMMDTATLAASTLTTVFAGNKTAAIAAAIINTAVGITRAMQLPPPFSWIQAGLIAATGAAQIATIKSTNVNSGGSAPTVSGTAGGGQEQPGMAPQTLMVQGLTPGQLLSSDYVRDLAQRLLDFQKDGGVVVLQ